MKLLIVNNTSSGYGDGAIYDYVRIVSSDGDEHCMRLIHRVYSAGGVEMGEALIRDVSFGVRSAAGAGFGFLLLR